MTIALYFDARLDVNNNKVLLDGITQACIMQSGSAYLFELVRINTLTLLVFLLTSVAASAKELPHEFTANYEVEVYGIVLARATHKVEHTANGLSMEVYTRPAGLMTLVSDDEVVVHADLVTNNGQLLLVNYEYTHTGDEEDDDVRFNIEWQNNHEQKLIGKGTGIYDGEKINIDFDKPIWDPLSAQALIIVNADKDIARQEHGLFLKGGLKHYLFENHGKEKISFNETEFMALKTVIKETERDRVIYVWMVPEFNNIPIKYERWKNGKLQSAILLRNVTFEKDGETISLSFTNDEEDFE
jgi:hypothetical protein